MKRRGRPFKMADGEPLERLNVRMRSDDLIRLRRRAMALGVTVSEMARECIVRGLDVPAVAQGED